MNEWRRVWLWPLLLAASTLLGLAVALLGEGMLWRSLWWPALSVPLAAIALRIAQS